MSTTVEASPKSGQAAGERPSVEDAVQGRASDSTGQPKRDHAEVIAMLAAGRSDDWAPLSQWRLLGCITMLLPLAGLVAGLLWLLRRQSGAAYLLVAATLVNAVYALVAVVLGYSLVESRISATVLTGVGTLWQAEQDYHKQYEVYGDFEELEDEDLIPADLGLVVSDGTNATDASGAVYVLESLDDEGFVIAAHHRRLHTPVRVSEKGAVRSEGSGGAQPGPAEPVAG